MKRILVVDDVAAVERFVRPRPDLVFLDINMPGANGLEVLKLLGQTDQKIPVIMVTANAENAIAAECIRQGAFGDVPKPFNLIPMDHMAAPGN